jgi:hypothetical protein
VALLPAGLAWGLLAWLRAGEPPGLDQSLFAYYGRGLARGLHLYRDLWDSKPPGIFALYALAVRGVGIEHAAFGLDVAAAAASVLLAAWILRGVGRVALGAGAFAFAVLPSAPVFGGPMLAGQAEPLMTPCLLAAMACTQRRALFAAGLLLGAAASMKLVALAWLPVGFVFARRESWRLLAGMAIPLGAMTLGTALAGTLDDAVAAVLFYPRAYAAEIASRTPLAPLLERGAVRLGRGLPLVLFLGLVGSVTARSPGSMARTLLVWIGCAIAAIFLQRQMAGYHLYFLVPPLALTAAIGAQTMVRFLARIAPARRAVAAALAAAAGTAALGVEAPLWTRHYRPHTQWRAGGLEMHGFLQELGGPGPAWLEAGAVTEPLRARARAGDRMLVWGLAPAVYARGDCLPFTRWVFHQTLLVVDSPLSRRWPDARARRAELLRAWDATPPRFAVIVRGDRSGLEPQQSQDELAGFEELARRLTGDYAPLHETKSYTLLERRASAADSGR